MKDYSQYGEGTILARFFEKAPPKHKLLVDVGAKGKSLSNTFGLLCAGWHGLLVEPHPESFKQLKGDVIRAGIDTQVKLFNLAITDEPTVKVVTFYLHPIAGHSSLIRRSDKSIKVKTARLPVLLEKESMPSNFGLLSVDTEGMDQRIICDLLVNSRFRPEVIVYEKQVDFYLEEFGYLLIAETPGNLIYRRMHD